MGSSLRGQEGSSFRMHCGSSLGSGFGLAHWTVAVSHSEVTAQACTVGLEHAWPRQLSAEQGRGMSLQGLAASMMVHAVARRHRRAQAHGRGPPSCGQDAMRTGSGLRTQQARERTGGECLPPRRACALGRAHNRRMLDPQDRPLASSSASRAGRRAAARTATRRTAAAAGAAHTASTSTAMPLAAVPAPAAASCFSRRRRAVHCRAAARHAACAQPAPASRRAGACLAGRRQAGRGTEGRGVTHRCEA